MSSLPFNSAALQEPVSNLNPILPITVEHPQSAQRVATATFWRTFHHDWKISPGCWGWWVHAHLLSPSRAKLQCMLQLRGQIHSPYFISTPVRAHVIFYTGSSNTPYGLILTWRKITYNHVKAKSALQGIRERGKYGQTQTKLSIPQSQISPQELRYINPLISITPRKPLMSSGSWLTLHNCEIFYFITS